MQGSTGSFAGGFMSAYLAARRQGMEEQRSAMLNKYYMSLMGNLQGGKTSNPQDIFTNAKREAIQSQHTTPGSSASSGATSAAPASAEGGTGKYDISQYDPAIQAAAKAHGISPEYLAKSIYIESRGNPAAANKSGAQGLLQFMPGTAKQYNVDPSDPTSSINGAAAYAADNKAALTKLLGRAPTDAELYLSHQQGAGGAAALIMHPDTPAGQLVSPANISGNNGDPNAPASAFTGNWASAYGSTPSYLTGATPGAPTQLSGGVGGSGSDALLSPDQVKSTLGNYASKDNVAIDPKTGTAYHFDTGLPFSAAETAADMHPIPGQTAIPGGPNTGTAYAPPQGPPQLPTTAIQVPPTLVSQDQTQDAAQDAEDTQGTQAYADGGPVQDDDTTQLQPSDMAATADASDAQYDDGANNVDPATANLPATDANYTQSALPVEQAGYGYSYNALGRMESQARHAGAPRIGSPTSSMAGGRMPSMGRMPSPSRSMRYDQSGIDPNYDPQVTDDNGDLSDGAVNAIQGGMQAIGRAFGLSNSAIPNSPQAADGRQRFLNGEGAMPADDVAKAVKAADPAGQLDDAMGNIAGLEALHKYYAAQGNVTQANNMTAAMLMTSRDTAAKYGAEAYSRLHRGDMDGALSVLQRGYDHIPDGRYMNTQKQSDGSVLVTQTNMQGKTIDQKVASPQDIFQAAIGLKNGTAYWNLLNESVSGRQPTQMSPALQQGLAGLSGAQPAADQSQGDQSGQGGQQSAPPPTAQAIPVAGQAPQQQPSKAAAPAPQAPQQAQQQALPVTPASAQAPAPGPSPSANTPAPTPVNDSSAAPQQAIPVNSGPMSAQPAQVQQVSAFTNSVYSQLPKMPANLQAPPPQGITDPKEVKLFESAQKTMQGNWYKQVFLPAKAEADKFIQSRVQYENQRALDDRSANANTMRMTQQSALETQRDAASAARLEEGKQADFNRQVSTPLKMDDPTMLGSDADAYTHAARVAPAAFTDPSTGYSSYDQRFNPADKQLVQDGIVNIARYSQTSPEMAARAVSSIVTPQSNNTNSANDAPPFNTTTDKQTGLTTVAFTNGFAVQMPAQKYTMLMNLRASQKKLRENMQSTEDEQGRRTSARGMQETQLRSRINTRNAAQAALADQRDRQRQMGIDPEQLMQNPQ